MSAGGSGRRVLTQYGQAHGDVNPIQHVLGFRGHQLRQGPHLLAAIGQEGDILVCLQSLAFQKLEQAALRLPIVAGTNPRYRGALS